MRNKDEWITLFENFKQGIVSSEFLYGEVERNYEDFKNQLTEFKKLLIIKMSAERYDLGHDYENGTIVVKLVPSEKGDWVEHAAYESFEEQISELEDQIKTLEANQA